MALNEEFLTGVFEGIENPKERIEKVLKEYEVDTTGLKVNKDQVLAEYKGYKEKAEKLATEWAAKEAEYKKQMEDLDKQIKSSGKDELKKYYEEEIKKAQDDYKVQIKDSVDRAAALEAENNKTFEEYLGLLSSVEFEKAAEKINNLDQSKKAILRDVFFGRNKFNFKEIDGVKKFRNVENHRDINDSLQTFIGTEEGKFFLLANSAGGGAPGSSNVKPPVSNPFIKGKENLDEQARILRENPALAATLKAQAAAIPKT